jgi:hypothetical protein
MTTIDEQIAYAQQLVNDGKYPEYARGIFASLQRLKSIDEVQVPEEPVFVTVLRHIKKDKNVVNLIAEYDTLRDLLRRETYLHQLDHSLADQWLKRAEAAEPKFAAVELELARLNGDAPYGN